MSAHTIKLTSEGNTTQCVLWTFVWCSNTPVQMYFTELRKMKGYMDSAVASSMKRACANEL